MQACFHLLYLLALPVFFLQPVMADDSSEEEETQSHFLKSPPLKKRAVFQEPEAILRSLKGASLVPLIPPAVQRKISSRKLNGLYSFAVEHIPPRVLAELKRENKFRPLLLGLLRENTLSKAKAKLANHYCKPASPGKTSPQGDLTPKKIKASGPMVYYFGSKNYPKDNR